MKRAILLLLALAVLPVDATAQEGAADTNYEPPQERRGGFSFGLAYGLGIGNYVGYPNEVEKIDNPEYRSSTGAAPAGGYSIWIGGALRDWFTIGAGLFSAGGGEEVQGGGGAFGLRIETFPLYGLGGFWRDLGISSEFGAGGGLLQDEDGEETANGGSMSMVGFGTFIEPWQFWQMSTGPALSSQYLFSDSMTAFSVLLSWRLAFYWTQPKAS